MRNLINIVESAQPFYHGSRNELAPGTILTPQSEGYVLGSGMDELEREAHRLTEKVLESNRPETAVSRLAAVFMVRHPGDIDYAGGYDDHVYEVEPNGPVTRCNLAWYSELYAYCQDDIDETRAAELAAKYWNAEPHTRSSGDLYEYLTPQAKIIREID